MRESQIKNDKLTIMSETTQKSLFFIKNPVSNVSAIELFLKKRGFQVYSESDLKTALLEIMKLNPDYIFLAWDHPSDRIANLPKIILQSMIPTIIAYCTSSDKNQIRKLQSSGQPYKLFPPLSGPAIHRLVLKFEKESQFSDIDPASKKPTSYLLQNKSNKSHLKSIEKNTDFEQFMSSLNESTSKPSEIYIDKGQRAKELRSQQRLSKPSSHLMYITPLQDIVASTEHKMTTSTKNQFDLKFDEHIKAPLAEMIETLVDYHHSDETLALQNENLTQAKFGFCIVIEHLKWSGYLIVASENVIDPLSLESILKNWINENLTENSTDPLPLTHGFEIHLNDIAYEAFSEQFADYSKTVLFDDKKTVISFFSVAPEFINLQLHDLHDMIEILTAEVPLSLPMPFDLYLYLPENKKFILYCKKDSLVAIMQLDRLKEKKVDKLYSSLEFELSLQKFRAEKRIQKLIENFKTNQKNNV